MSSNQSSNQSSICAFATTRFTMLAITQFTFKDTSQLNILMVGRFQIFLSRVYLHHKQDYQFHYLLRW